MNPFTKLSFWCAVTAVLVLGTFAGSLALGHPPAFAAVAAAFAAVAVAFAAVAAGSVAIAVALAAAAAATVAVAAFATVEVAAFASVVAIVLIASSVVLTFVEEFSLKKRWAFALLGAEAASITVAMLAFGSPSGIVAASIAIAALLLGIGMLGRGRALRPPSAA